MQKKTKIALLMLAISAVVLTVTLLFVVRPSGNEPVVNQPEDGPEVTVTPTPEPEINENENNEEIIVPVEPEGLTNGQKYYTKLVEEGSRNILLIGQDAVYGAYDFAAVVSIDEKTKSMKIINFPRDIYIDYNDKILDQLKEKDPDKAADNSIQKLNAAHAIAISLRYQYESGGKFGKVTFMNFWADLLEEVFDIPIDDYIIVKKEGFREIIDFFGGVYINVPIYMHYEDPMQNLYIHLEPGPQTLYGADAEGFMRFRQGYTPEGEFKTHSVYFRQKNQNEFIKAFFEQHVNISNLGKVGNFADIITKNVRTSVDEWSEIAQYSGIMLKAITDKYEGSSCIVECLPNNKMIRGISYEIIKTE